MFRSTHFGVAALARVTGALFVAAATSVAAHAQVASEAISPAVLTASPATPSTPVIDAEAQLKAPLNLNVPDSAAEESSSVVASLEPVALGADPAAADGGGQPPPYRRRRYGTPNYNDRYHNKDGSNRLAFVAGGGFTLPTGSTGKQFNTSYSLKGGAGINLSRKFAVIGEFSFDRFGLQGNVLASQLYKYSHAGFVDGNNNPIDFSGLDAHSYIWSFTANPTFTFHQGEKTGAYVVVGGGFYHKVVNFTLPQVGTGYSPFYGYYQFGYNQTFDHYADNTGGVNGGRRPHLYAVAFLQPEALRRGALRRGLRVAERQQPPIVFTHPRPLAPATFRSPSACASSPRLSFKPRARPNRRALLRVLRSLRPSASTSFIGRALQNWRSRPSRLGKMVLAALEPARSARWTAHTAGWKSLDLRWPGSDPGPDLKTLS